MKTIKQTAGFLGGIQTYLRYGPEHMKKIGKLGGRPRKKTRPAPDTAPAESSERRYQNETTEKGMTPKDFMTRWNKAGIRH